MKIVFWSPIPGQSGTTGSILALATLAVLKLKKNIILTHTQFLDHSLEQALLGKNAEKDMFEDIGMDALLRISKAREPDKKIIDTTVLSIMNNWLHLLPGSMKENKYLFEADIVKCFPFVFQSINKCYDSVFLDTGAGFNAISKLVLEEADIIVVTLNQNKNNIDEYFFKYHLPEEKLVYLIGKYDCNSRYNLKNLERSYLGLKGRTGVVPYNVEYMDAMIDGKVIQYMVKNITSGKGEKNQNFLKSVGNSLDIILRKVENSR